MMRIWVVLLCLWPIALPAQVLFDFPRDWSYDSAAVEAAAEQGYRERLIGLYTRGNLDTDRALLSRVQRLLRGLAAAARTDQPGAAEIPWEVHTCRRCGESASAMVGGRLLVGEEFVQTMGFSDAELAYVLAHEMAHVLAEHAREYASVARHFVSNGRDRQYEDVQREVDESFIISRQLSPLYARQELEADRVGFMLGALGGHDPQAMLSMLRKLHGDDSGAGFGLHPEHRARVENARAMLHMAQRVRERYVQLY